MVLTRNFRETLQARAKKDPAYREAMLTEAVGSFLAGESDGLDEAIHEILMENAQRLEIDVPDLTLRGRFGHLIREAARKYGARAVVLEDEYDKPILDNIADPAVAAQMREGVKNLYSVFKGQDAHLQFVFMTGVSKFSKVSLFSGVNQLEDITLDTQYGAICGYTQKDLDRHFSDHLQGADRDRIRQWYQSGLETDSGKGLCRQIPGPGRARGA